MNNLDNRVTDMISVQETWQEEYKLLREIVLSCGLDEDFKWMHPAYNFEDTNVLLIHSFKEYIAILFQKGVLLKDDAKLLIQQTENVQAGRQLRFKTIEEIESSRDIIRTYVFEAIEIERAGLKVEYKKDEVEVFEELQAVFDERPDVEKAFWALTPGRQRGYVLYFNGAKQSKTKTSRIEKSIDKILAGKGYMDR